ncbi:MazG nucleotide pyrophosphohydrolase domain-containing protein [Lichenibacterium ramalinae]|uniref:Nucleotide pyrophosphohydrolase n=1 Tax=Lichenibacterium ramalinae TaxID=2316527 RepID=A0A4Q2R6X1_9HYPH|nr:MazG nucleotide pyrophosphohydrolase domain-containing protein [Lichenibacterium ramalinae]RYB01453.1 nucleotide pyrophosphohydrolase [Lichenibacterium ramalinae]
MRFASLVEKQVAADRRRGFRVDFENDMDRLAQLEMDLVGLTGEVGEFANLLKKVRLAASHQDYDGPSLRDASSNLREELADALVYLIRLSFILGGDLEVDLTQKMKINERRYGPLER